VALFVGALFNVDLSSLIAVLFVAAMGAFVGGLVSFLREIFVATASLRIGRG
jgi:membrane protein DedA with SNARE-associated domain